ncbi:MAG: type II secretion system protein [Verrucomicrobia bacterium]|nr:MAG: type II secretion system protein [Verrucomicrobiota bacterium]
MPRVQCGGEEDSGRLAFTLIELLAVIAVVALLAGLVLPALGRSKVSAQRIRCFANLRQLGLVAQMYWDENNGNAFWFGWLARGREGKRAFDPTFGALFPYLGGRGVEICPALNYALREFKLKASGAPATATDMPCVFRLRSISRP